jgi:hypothetical protein
MFEEAAASSNNNRERRFMRRSRGNPYDFLPLRFAARRFVRISGESAKTQPRKNPVDSAFPEDATHLRHKIEAGDLRASLVCRPSTAFGSRWVRGGDSCESRAASRPLGLPPKSRRDFFPFRFSARRFVRISGKPAKPPPGSNRRFEPKREARQFAFAGTIASAYSTPSP